MKLYIAALFLVALGLVLAPVAFCSDMTGEVTGPQGPVAGAEVTVTDAGGNVVGSATTNDSGRYCITGLSPGTYKSSVNPPPGAGFKPGGSTDVIPADGLTADWSLSAAPGSSSTRSPGACGGYFASGLGAFGAGFLGVGVLGGIGVGICAGVGCFSTSSGPPASPSK